MSIPTEKQNARRGFTLIELVTALTLSAMIMAVLLGLVARLSMARDILIKKHPFEPWKTLLQDQLQRDYVGCRSILISPTRISMNGYSDFIDTGGVRRSGPCSIEYYIVSDERENWVFREQINLLATPPDNVRKELVCRAISRFRSLDELSTDIAPGILRIELSLTELDPLKPENIGRRNLDSILSPNTIPVVLLRHGAIR